jgi:hypothetical protein
MTTRRWDGEKFFPQRRKFQLLTGNSPQVVDYKSNSTQLYFFGRRKMELAEDTYLPASSIPPPAAHPPLARP